MEVDLICSTDSEALGCSFKSPAEHNYNMLRGAAYEEGRIQQKEMNPKGQIKSEWIYEVIVTPKMQTKNYKDFCPSKQTRIIAKQTAYFHQKITKKSATILVCLVGQKSLQFFVCILGETMTSWINSEFKWPLARPCPKVCANLQTKIEAMIAWLEHNKSDMMYINCDALD